MEEPPKRFEDEYPEEAAILMSRYARVVPRSNSLFTAVRSRPKVGRNERCPCGSGKKVKTCCTSYLE